MKICKNCQKKCVSTYCCRECKLSMIKKTKWVIVKCKTCGLDIECRISRLKQYCSLKCLSSNKKLNEKRISSLKKTCLEKYGKESIMQTEFGKQCLKNSIEKKYGVDHYSKTDKFKTKFKNTCLDRHGVEYPQQSNIIKEKSKKSFIEKYGGFTLQSDVLKEKVKQTKLVKYGDAYYNNRTKTEITNLEKYGFTTPLKNEEIKEKTAKTLNEKYSVINISQYPENKIKVATSLRNRFLNFIFNGDRLENKVIPLFKPEDYTGIDYNIKYPFKCNACDTEFKDNLYAGHVPRCPKCHPPSISIPQSQVYDFIKSLNPSIEIIQNTRSVIAPQEIDIYLPSLKLAIEYDGLYWHGELSGGKDKNYHLSKTIACEKRGIKLIHIFEDEWLNKQSIVQSRLKHILGLSSETIYARNCIVKEIDFSTASIFLSNNHLQGSDKSAIRLGLYNNDKLVAAITFGKLRLALGQKNIKSGEYEMLRFCNVIDSNIIGGASKLLAYFIKQYKPSKIISYADKRYSNNNAFYAKIGFRLTGETKPNYWYVAYNEICKHHRFNFRKDQLNKKLEFFDANLTEWQNMQLNGYDRIWDCGHYKYEWVA